MHHTHVYQDQGSYKYARTHRGYMHDGNMHPGYMHHGYMHYGYMHHGYMHHGYKHHECLKDKVKQARRA